ncbi:MAG: hypothetical protein AAF525_21285, partial [Pseudomonadota bacterium]
PRHLCAIAYDDEGCQLDKRRRFAGIGRWDNPLEIRETDMKHQVTELDDGRLLALLIEIPDLSVETVEALPRYLTEHIHEVHTADFGDNVEFMQPVAQLPNGFQLRERSLWQLIVANTQDPYNAILDYVREACHDNDGRTDMGLADETTECVAYSVFAVLDHIFYLEQTTFFGTEVLPAFDAFQHYLSMADMDHETAHQQYIFGAIPILSRLDEWRLLDLVQFRVTEGQHPYAIDWPNSAVMMEALSPDGRLKKLIDRILWSADRGFHRTEVFEDLIGVVYGEKPEATVACQYVTDKLAQMDIETKTSTVGVSGIGKETGSRMYHPTWVNTGFHRKNAETSWHDPWSALNDYTDFLKCSPSPIWRTRT